MNRVRFNMITQLVKNRNENLSYLIFRQYGTQTALAVGLLGSGYTQSSISNLLLLKSPFYDHKARTIEKYLVLPTYWLDKEDWIRSGWDLIETYRNMSKNEKRVFNETVKFIQSMR